jgi:hypothetical protein
MSLYVQRKPFHPSLVDNRISSSTGVSSTANIIVRISGLVLAVAIGGARNLNQDLGPSVDF